MGAFKIRGAYNMVSQLSPDQLKRGVITYSSGNHGQAVAMAAQMMGAPAVIVMPTTAPAVKIDGCKSFGAEVVFAGTTSLERQARAEQILAERGLTMVPPFDHMLIITGQGTVGLEILEQVPDVATVVIPSAAWVVIRRIDAIKRPSHRSASRRRTNGRAKMSKSLEAGHRSRCRQKEHCRRREHAPRRHHLRAREAVCR